MHGAFEPGIAVVRHRRTRAFLASRLPGAIVKEQGREAFIPEPEMP
jgi:hypothetical protein